MRLVLIVFVQLHLIYVHCGVVKDIIGAVASEIHQVQEDIHGFIPHHHYSSRNSEPDEKENTINSSYAETVESENESNSKLFGSREQRDSNEAYTHSRHERPNCARHSFHGSNNRRKTKENSNHNHVNDFYKDGEYISKDVHSKFTNEYTSNSNTASSKPNEDFWNNDKKQDNAGPTSEYYNSREKNIIVNQSEGNNNQQNSEQDNGFRVIYPSTTRIDQIVFPGKVNLSTPKTCPEGLVIAANGDCLEPIVIHMGNRTKNDDNTRGGGRSAFVAGCLPGFSKTEDGQCAEVIYD